MLLDADVLKRTIVFGEAWNLAQGMSSSLGDAPATLEAWFDHIGWGDRYRAEWAEMPLWIELPDDLEITDKELVERFLLPVIEGFGGGPDDIDNAAVAVAKVFAHSGRLGASTANCAIRW